LIAPAVELEHEGNIPGARRKRKRRKRRTKRRKKRRERRLREK